MNQATNPIGEDTLESTPSEPELVPEKLKTQLKQCRDLPSLPGVAFQLIQQFRESTVDLKRTAEIIQKDPALTASILRFVNSAAFGIRREITSVTHAISLLGLNAVRTLALSFSLVRGLRSTDHTDFDYARFWQRSLLSAMAARALGVSRGASDREGLFLAGLLQDIGMLALQVLIPRRYGELCRLAEQDHTKLYELERATLGVDHTQVGAWLAEAWELPKVFGTFILGSHNPEAVDVAEELRPSLDSVVLSGWFAEIWLDQSAALIHLKSRAWMRLMGGMQSEELKKVADEMQELMEDFPALFEIEVGDCEKADEILIEARDQLAAISLDHIQHARNLELEREELANENVDLKERSYTDSLTGLFNRAYLDEFLVEEFLRCAALDKPASVIFCDLNDFKPINDIHGHQTGDIVLKKVAEAIQSEIRQIDQAVRFGGDEFVVFLPESDQEHADKIAQRIDEAVTKLSIQSAQGELIPTSAAVGFSTHSRSCRFHSLEALCHAADVELYKIKRERKKDQNGHLNNVASASTPTPTSTSRI